jgi:hypothetical protein
MVGILWRPERILDRLSAPNMALSDKPVGHNSLCSSLLKRGKKGFDLRFLELPQRLSLRTHLRVKNFVRGVFARAIADKAFVGQNSMEETKAGG